MPSRTRIVILMHPKEWKREKSATGRLTHLCLANSEIQVGVGFDDHEAVQALIHDPGNFPMLLYPDKTARVLPDGLRPEEIGARRLVVFLLDGTWACSRKMLRLSTTLQRLPRLACPTGTVSRFVIKRQPRQGCLSTIEATHELLAALERAGLDEYPQPDQLLDVFMRMQQHQIACAENPPRPGYRNKPYKLSAS